MLYFTILSVLLLFDVCFNGLMKLKAKEYFIPCRTDNIQQNKRRTENMNLKKHKLKDNGKSYKLKSVFLKISKYVYIKPLKSHTLTHLCVYYLFILLKIR